MSPTVAIAGISSRLARLIAKELLKTSSIALRGSCRDVRKLPRWLHEDSRVTLLQTGPYDETNLRSLVKGCDVVICCYLADNETMTSGQKTLIDLCEEEGVPRYVASDYTGDHTKLGYGDVMIKDPMKHIKAHLDGSRVQGVHILVGLFIESYWELFGFWSARDRCLSYWGSGNEQWELTSYATTAQYVAAVVLDPDATGLLKFLAERKSTIEIAHDLEAVYGITPTLKCLGSLADLEASKDLGNGQQNPFAAGAYHMLSGHWPVGDDPQNNRYPDIVPETVRGYLEKNDVLKTEHSNTFREYFKANNVLGSEEVSDSGIGSA